MPMCVTSRVINIPPTVKVESSAPYVLTQDTLYANGGRCDFVLLTQDEYAKISTAIAIVMAGGGNGGGSTGGTDDMSVSADIFVGVALVICLAVGWIAGAQR